MKLNNVFCCLKRIKCFAKTYAKQKSLSVEALRTTIRVERFFRFDSFLDCTSY